MNSDAIYDVLMDIGKHSSHKAKIELLSRYTHDDDFKKVLFYAMNPHYTYYINKFPYHGQGYNQFDSMTIRMLDVMRKRRLSGDLAKKTLAGMAYHMTPRSCDLLRMIVQKNLRVGLGASLVNGVFPDLIPTFSLMKGEWYEDHRVRYPCYGSPKIDGVRGSIKEGRIFSFSGKPLLGMDHLIKGRPSNIEFDGEINIPGMSFDKASGLIRSNNPTPQAWFSAFDLPLLKGGLHLRYPELLALNEPYLMSSVVTHTILHNKEELLEYYAYCVRMGYEGIMIKNYDSPYERKKGWHWMKLKPVDPVDIEVTGIYEGKLNSKYQGMVGGLYADFKGSVVDVGSGLSDEQRRMWWKNPELIIGKTIEVKYQEITKAGSLRFPRLNRIRYSK